ncbi:exonuclease domain-containing protein [Sphaerisporangium aureirubrum]|uniref:Exonuclease domain-containing protein n=1 Tax=Sphaerisporangium aureirubrum TaxID=1544736 RepID=A0ABW1NCL2_9ACTN
MAAKQRWYLGPLLPWDTESTGVDVETDRIVTAALVWIRPDEKTMIKHHLIDPGVPIPAEAIAIHGITNERVAAEGRQPEGALEEIADDLVDALNAGWPLVGMNCVYDLTLLDRELRRHGLRTLEERRGGEPIAPVIDAMVLDKLVDPPLRGKGRRRLTALCEIWGVRLDGAHDAHFDALAAARVVWKIARTHPEIGEMSLPDLHALQVKARAQQCAELRAYFDSVGKPHDGVPGEWPMLPYRERAAV